MIDDRSRVDVGSAARAETGMNAEPRKDLPSIHSRKLLSDGRWHDQDVQIEQQVRR